MSRSRLRVLPTPLSPTRFPYSSVSSLPFLQFSKVWSQRSDYPSPEHHPLRSRVTGLLYTSSIGTHETHRV
ncbi:hypothetical protein A2U01_0079265, partial [Trifolium medium]|nr:hypothetical protein [Trifolium medium]